MRINKNLVHQVGDQTKVILRYTANQPSRKETFVVSFILGNSPASEESIQHSEHG